MTRAHAEIVACSTCGGAEREADGRSRGEHLLSRLSGELAGRGDVAVSVTSVRCLWACKRSCAVMLRSAERVGYVIVDLAPNEVSARALVDYAELYLATADGAVPYKAWPDALKGHFHCRIPKSSEPHPSAGAEPRSEPGLVGETRSPRRVSPNVEEIPNADMPIWPGSTRPSPAQRGRGEPGTDLGHEVLAPQDPST
jgi:predicted metal-binding protein